VYNDDLHIILAINKQKITEKRSTVSFAELQSKRHNITAGQSSGGEATLGAGKSACVPPSTPRGKIAEIISESVRFPENCTFSRENNSVTAATIRATMVVGLVGWLVQNQKPIPGPTTEPTHSTARALTFTHHTATDDALSCRLCNAAARTPP
uniref:Uncharacterized protein n=1 Tax=Anopheles quadriannulatus TaxID=34691 RepID=A0A182XSW4_ANOQN